MSAVGKFIESGILEVYVLGQCTTAEAAEVERMAMLYKEVRQELDEINKALERYAHTYAVQPDHAIGPFLLATIDYMDRMKQGEAPAFPPILHEGSTIADYAEWLNRPDLQLTEELIDAHARIIGYNPQGTTAIAWLKYGSPEEVHTNEYEKFMIVEGTCDIIIGDTVHKMQPGGVIFIPLHVPHSIVVTSDIPCKVILQRIPVAA